jgi:hypothetical protein
MNSRVLLIAIAGIAARGGCSGNPPPTAQGGGPGPGGPVVYAVARLTTAQCERDERCGDVGQGKKHASRNACESVMRETFEEDDRFTDCRRGIDEAALAKCMNEVRNGACGNPMRRDSESECHGSRLCSD